MALGNTTETFGLVSRSLHWLIALLIFALVALGWYMVDLTYFDRWYNQSLSAHKALGLLVLVLGLGSLLWRLVSPLPLPIASLSTVERRAAVSMHHLLLLLIIAIPASGYLISTSAGKAVEIFSWFEVPALFSVGNELRDIAIELHFWLAYGILGLAGLHLLAALKHHFVNRDRTLLRMLGR